MTASQWLDWALSVVNTAPPKPAQDLIVGYADSHDIARDGHDFWVSRQPGKNTVPLYANPININSLTAEAWCNGYEAATKQFKREWVGLTDEEIDAIADQLDDTTIGWSTHEFARAIEAKLKKNNITP